MVIRNTAGIELSNLGYLKPNHVREETGERSLSFGGKQRIPSGPMGLLPKYGFRYELVAEKPISFMQSVTPDFDMEGLYFGVYRDPELEEPIEEADAGYNFEAEWKQEEGADLKDFPDYKPAVRLMLEPGTYYIGLYTNDPFADMTVNYISWYGEIEQEIDLTEKNAASFFAREDKDTFFKVHAPAAGTYEISSYGFAGELVLCSERKEPVSEAVPVPVEKKRGEAWISFSVPEAGTYYFKLSDYPAADFGKFASYDELVQNNLKVRFKTDR